MLTFDVAPRERFTVRAAAIIRRDGHVLLHRGVNDDFWVLPGGRIEFGETAAATIEREMIEELARPAKVVALRYVVENFFSHDGFRVHELGYYFDAEITGDFPFAADGVVCFRSRDRDLSSVETELEFAWVRPEPATLIARRLYPMPLRTLLARPGGGTEHLVIHEP
jgi:8-oxo-dGTP pyrophosphatase MutT (NUDIX family)